MTAFRPRSLSQFLCSLAALTLVSLPLAACGGGGGGTEVTEQLVGAEGGAVEGPAGSSLDVPAGALEADTALVIATTGEDAAVSGVVPLSEIFEIGPSGTQFAVPVSLTLPYDSGQIPDGRTTADAAVYTAQQQAGPYEALSTAATGDAATAAIEHLSFFFVGVREVEGGGDLPDPDTYVFSDTVSFLARIQVPTADELGTCCFDYSGDGTPDNQTGVLLSAMIAALDPETDMDLTNSIQQAIDADRTSYVLEFRDMPTGDGPVDLKIWPSNGDLDRDGTPDQSALQRFSGEGVFQVERVGFTENSTGDSFASASIEGGVLTAEGGEVTVKLGMRGGDFITLPIMKLALEGAVDITEAGIATPDVTVGDYQATTGLRAGGVIPVRGFLAHLEAVAPTCACAEVDPSQPVIEYSMTGGELRAACVQDILETAEENCHSQHQGFLCGQLDQLCRTIPLLGTLADVSSGVPGDDGLLGNDAFSFGALLSLAPATLAENTLGETLVAVDDEYVVRPDRPYYRLDVLGNDVDAVNGEPHIASVTQPDAGTVTILGDGLALQYEIEEGRAGMFEFTYTIEAGGESATATVLVVVLEGWVMGPSLEANDDEVTVELNRGPQTIEGLLDNDDIPEDWAAAAQISTLLSWRDALVEIGPDRHSIIYRPGSTWSAGDQAVVGYGISTGRLNMYMGSAEVTINLVAPETECGDGWIDEWSGEECDPGPGRVDPQCDAQCKIVGCEGGYAPVFVYADEDEDTYGDPMKPAYTCEAVPAGYVYDNTDCDDSDENVHPGAEEVCGDGINNACGLTHDCGLADCALQDPCGEDLCDDGADNDGDGHTDCDDPQCADSEACAENCTDGIDNDGNGLIDCYDEMDCGWVEPCRETICDDGQDGDLDGLTDCDDPECAWLCPESDCFDGIDNDHDYETDCEDMGCHLICPEDDCADGFDDDFDGLRDCDDPGCAADPACQ